MPLEVKVATNKELTEQEAANTTEYRASINFSIDNDEHPVTYVLCTNPVFVTLSACRPMGGNGTHEVHLRELPRFQENTWTVEMLKDHTPDDDEVVIINATGKGSEVLARAWCAERGKNAIIRRTGGPCFVCAVRGASQAGLKVGIFIGSLDSFSSSCNVYDLLTSVKLVFTYSDLRERRTTYVANS